MHVITRQRLQAFWQTHPDAERPLKAWLAIVRLKRYSGPPAVREDFAAASFLGKWRTVLNIGGNKYRWSSICAMISAASTFAMC